MLKVTLDLNGSSPNPQTSIWLGQHVCVSEDSRNAKPLSESDCGLAVVKHQLRVGHWSVLDQAYVRFQVYGFPHSVMCQLTRHHELYPLVQSGRYTGERFIKVFKLELPVTDVFYFREPGHYTDRQGKKYLYTEQERESDIRNCLNACVRYEYKIYMGYSEEHARDIIPYNFRQDFCVAGSLRKIFHMLDQRGNKDSQLEIQTLANMIMDELDKWCPEIASYYRETRFTKARLAP